MTTYYYKVNYALLCLLFLFSGSIIKGKTLEKSGFNNSSQLLWVYLSDKNNQGDKLHYPARTKNRLKKSGWQTNETDFGLNNQIISKISHNVDSLRHTSRALGAVSVSATYNQYKKLLTLPYVNKIEPVAVYIEKIRTVDRKPLNKKSSQPEFYGDSYKQLEQIGIPDLHNRGLTGKGVRIALLDAGFDKSHEVFNKILKEDRFIAERDFIFNDHEVSNENREDTLYRQDSHGTAVWSLIGGYNPGTLIGGAYKAEFVLAKTERIKYERRTEEDNFVAAVEWADSLGVDIISASLGYRIFDNFEYSYSDLDGETARTTKIVNWAKKRGITVVVSAGNQDDDIPTDGGLTTPADAPGAISVGAVNSLGHLTNFSSHGPTADGRRKPELCARGNYNFIASTDKSEPYDRGNGTSYAAPLISAGCALLLEQYPQWSPDTLLQELKKYASNSDNPNDTTGWGIPNFHKTYYENLEEFKPKQPIDKDQVYTFPNPVHTNSVIYFKNIPKIKQSKGKMIIYNIKGQEVYSRTIRNDLPSWNLKNNSGTLVGQGIYLIHIKSGKHNDKFGRITIVR